MKQIMEHVQIGMVIIVAVLLLSLGVCLIGVQLLPKGKGAGR